MTLSTVVDTSKIIDTLRAATGITGQQLQFHSDTWSPGNLRAIETSFSVQKGSGHVLLCLEYRDSAGDLLAKQELSGHPPKTGEVWAVALDHLEVLTQWRENGLASSLTKQLADALKARGVEKLDINADALGKRTWGKMFDWDYSELGIRQNGISMKTRLELFFGGEGGKTEEKLNLAKDLLRLTTEESTIDVFQKTALRLYAATRGPAAALMVSRFLLLQVTSPIELRRRDDLSSELLASAPWWGSIYFSSQAQKDAEAARGQLKARLEWSRLVRKPIKSLHRPR